MAWSWKPPSDSKLAALLLDAMKALESYLKGAEKYLPVRDRTLTTDGNAKTLSTIPIAVDTTVLIVAYIVARRTGGTSGAANDGAAYRLEVAAKNTAGTAAELAAETLAVIGESQAGWTVASSASGGDILLRVTGAADNNVQWRASVKTLSVKE